MRAYGLLLTSAVLGLGCVSCGYIGDPLPPALNIAATVTDLRVIESGDQLTVDFTIPELTTEGLVLKRLGSVELRIGPGSTPFDTNQWAAAAKMIPLPATEPGKVHAGVPASEWIGKDIVAGVRVINTKGRASSWSNLVALRVIPPLATPAEVTVTSDPKGARVTWKSPEHSFLVFRQGPNEKEPALAGNAVSPEYTDTTAQYGTPYTYLVQSVRDKAESRLSAPVEFTPRDEFPPAVPTGLNAVAGIGSIELAWDPNADSDLRGYRVYRAIEGGAFERISELVDAPAFSDRKIEAGKKYRYAVSSVDQTGNESKQSTAVEVTAP